MIRSTHDVHHLAKILYCSLRELLHSNNHLRQSEPRSGIAMGILLLSVTTGELPSFLEICMKV